MNITNALYYCFVNYMIFNLTFYISNALLFMIDYFHMFIEYKVQKNAISVTNIISETYNKSIRVVLINSLIYTIPALLLLGVYEMTYACDFCVIKFFYDIVIARLLAEIFFYVIHVACHSKLIYKFVHKKHHEITTPVGITTLYMTPIDLYISNILPIYLPLVIINAHPITFKFWIVTTTINAVIFAHSGFKQIASSHDHHHSHLNKNYGTDLFMDKLFGTYEYIIENE